MDLTDILRKSKALMSHETLQVKADTPEKPNPEFSVPENLQENLKNSGPLTENAILNSGLPDSIKEAMINTPINPNPVMDIANDPAYADLLEDTQTPQTLVTKKQNVTETTNSGLSESVIRFIVKEEIEKAIQKIKKPTISESQLQNTMLKMIKEGKLTIKKK